MAKTLWDINFSTLNVTNDNQFKAFGGKYTHTENLTNGVYTADGQGSTPTFALNAVDIDWNGAYIASFPQDISYIHTTGDLINAIKYASNEPNNITLPNGDYGTSATKVLSSQSADDTGILTGITINNNKLEFAYISTLGQLKSALHVNDSSSTSYISGDDIGWGHAYVDGAPTELAYIDSTEDLINVIGYSLNVPNNIILSNAKYGNTLGSSSPNTTKILTGITIKNNKLEYAYTSTLSALRSAVQKGGITADYTLDISDNMDLDNSYMITGLNIANGLITGVHRESIAALKTLFNPESATTPMPDSSSSPDPYSCGCGEGETLPRYVRYAYTITDNNGTQSYNFVNWDLTENPTPEINLISGEKLIVQSSSNSAFTSQVNIVLSHFDGSENVTMKENPNDDNYGQISLTIFYEGMYPIRVYYFDAQHYITVNVGYKNYVPYSGPVQNANPDPQTSPVVTTIPPETTTPEPGSCGCGTGSCGCGTGEDPEAQSSYDPLVSTTPAASSTSNK